MIYALLLVNVGNYVSGAAAISTVLKINLPLAAFITNNGNNILGAGAVFLGNRPGNSNFASVIDALNQYLVNVGNYVSGAAAISTVLKINLPLAAFITAIVST
jgi:SSS family solute:Na+ symporter